MAIFVKFSEFSGFKINFEKTKILRIGSVALRNDQLTLAWPIQWDTKIRVLGVDFTVDYAETRKINFDNLIQKVRASIAVWALRSLTVIGKILVVNALLVSQFVYKLVCLYTPEDQQFKKFKILIIEFIWEGKTTKIAYNHLIQSHERGGLKLVDLEMKNASLKASWVDRIVYTRGENRLKLLKSLLPLNSPEIWECNIEPKQI